MSELNPGGETKREVELVQATATIDTEDLEYIRSRVVREVKLVEATKQLVKAGRQILELEDIHNIEDRVEVWAKSIPESNFVSVVGDPDIISPGARIQLASNHPDLVAVNEREGANCYVAGFDLASDKVVISGDADMYGSSDPKSSFACLFDTSKPTQDTVVHILTYAPNATGDQKDKGYKKFVEALIGRLGNKSPTSDA